ncbi:MAG: MFS transporter [Promethearchaeota archaeon]|jgi:DHA1 family tetracycline resistance protein-like MFS transporter
METRESQADEEHKDYLAQFQINPGRAMFTIILSIFVDTLGYVMVMPLLPGIVKGLGGSDFLYGLLISSNAIMILIFGPIWGKLSDRHGRKKILVISQMGTGIAFFILIFSDSILIILIARLIDGMFSGQMPIVRAYISDITTPQTRASHLGKIMTGYTSSMIIGPFIGGALGYFNWRFPMIFACFVVIISIIFTITILVESMPKERIEDLKNQKLLKEESSEESKRIVNKEVGLRFVEIFILSLISMIFNTSFSLILFNRYFANALVIGTMMAVSAGFVMIYGLFFMRKLILRIGEKKMFFLGIAIFIAIFVIYPYLEELWMIYVLMIPLSFSSASIGPLISSNLTKAVGPDKQGALGGWTTNISAVSQTISPLISTGLLQLGSLAIGFIYLNSYQLIGFLNAILGIFLMTIVFLDIRHYPYLYSYDKFRKKHREEQKKKKKEAKLKKKAGLKEEIV